MTATQLLWVSDPAEPHPWPDQKKRQSFAESCLQILKPLAKAKGWSCRQSHFYKLTRGDFIHTSLMFAADRLQTWVTFHRKPAALDPLFWDIVGIDHRRWRTSARGTKVVALRSPIAAEASWSDASRDCQQNADNVLTEMSHQEAKTQSTDNFAETLKIHPDRSRYLVTETIALLAEGRVAEAKTLCRDIREGRLTATSRMTFASPDGQDEDVFALIMRWINQNSPTPNRGT